MLVPGTYRSRHVANAMRVLPLVVLPGTQDRQPAVSQPSYAVSVGGTRFCHPNPNTHVESINLASSARRRRFLSAGLLLLISAVPVLAGSIRLQWDPCTASNIAGYRLYCGTASGAYATVKDVGVATITDVTNLAPGGTYHLAVSSYSSEGLESPLSTEIIQYLPPGNEPPAANPATVTVPEDGAIAITLTGSDADGDSLKFTVVGNPTHGSLSGTAPSVTYRPAANYNGKDSFTFTVEDGIAAPSEDVVSITVTPVNDPPVASPIAVTTPAGKPVVIHLSGSDIDGDALSFLNSTAVTHGSLSGTGPDLTYTPATGYSGSDSFSYQASDGKLSSAPAPVSITITASNVAPTATSFAVTTAEDIPVSTVLKGADVNGDSLTYRIITSPSKGTLSGDAPNLVYTPKADYSGNDAFTYSVSDGKLTSPTATVSVKVTAVDDTPIAYSKTIAVNEDSSTAFNLDAHDAEGKILTYKVTTNPVHGVLVASGRNCSYKPNANFNGTDSLKFTASDGNSTSTAGTVTLSVKAVNDAPKASNASFSVQAGKSIAMTLKGSDVDGDKLTYTVIKSPSKGTLSGTAPSLTYTAKSGVSGSDSFQFTVKDASVSSAAATISITLTAATTVASTSDTIVVPQGGTVTQLASSQKTLLSSDTTEVHQQLTTVLEKAPARGEVTLNADGSFSYRHFGGQNVADAFTYSVTEADGTRTDVQIDVHVFDILGLSSTGSDLELEFSATAGFTYDVQYQDTVAVASSAWQTLTSVQPESDGIVTVTDPGAVGLASRVYRVRCATSQGTVVSDIWGYQQLPLALRGGTPAAPFYGPMLRCSRVTAVNGSSLELEGSDWAAGILGARDGFASHIATIIASSDPAAVGSWWPIVGNDTRNVALDAAPQDLAARLQPGDLVEIRGLVSAAEVFGATGARSVFTSGDLLTLFSNSGGTVLTLQYTLTPEGASAYYLLAANGDRIGPIDATHVTFNPDLRFYCRRASSTASTACAIGRVPESTQD